MTVSKSPTPFAPLSQERLILEFPVGYPRLKRDKRAKDLMPQERQITLARLIIELRGLYEIINKIRAEAGLKELMEYKSPNPFSHFLPLIDDMSRDQRVATIEGALLIVNKYNLSDIWLPSMHLAILTHHLYVPPEEKPKILTADSIEPITSSTFNTLYRKDILSRKNIIIEITQPTTINELQTVISNNKVALERAMKDLKGTKGPKLEDRLLILGDLVRAIKEELPEAKWPEILQYLYHMRSTLDTPGSPVRMPLLPDSYDDLRIMYNRYIKAHRQLDPDS